MSLKYRIAVTVFLLEAVMMSALLGFTLTDPDDRLRGLGIAAIGMTIIALAGILLGHILTHRLEQLMVMAERLAQGDVKARARESGTDETARLSRAFNHMAERISTAIAELRASEERNRIMAERSPAAIWVFDVEKFCLIDVNDNFARLLKSPREQVLGSTPMAVSPPLQVDGIATEDYAKQLIARTLAGEEVIAPWTLRDAHGVDICCELRVVNLPMPGRIWICGIITDISERLKAEEALRHRVEFEDLIMRLSAQFISLPVESADAGIHRALEEIGRFADVDRSYVFRFSADASTFSYTHEWCGPGIQPEIDRLQNHPVADYPWALSRLLRGELVHVPSVRDCPPAAAAERAEWEAEMIRSLILVPMRSGDRVVGFVGFDSVRAENTWPQENVALLTIFADLVANVLHRRDAETAVRRQAEALRLANIELEHSNSELQQFAYIASHDLKAPLRTVSSYAQLLDRRYRKRLDNDATAFLDFIRDAVGHMHALIDDLLRLSRVDARNCQLAPVSVREVVEKACRQLEADIRVKGARVHYADLPDIRGDASMLTQLFQNLIANAIKFQKPGTQPEVWIEATPEGGGHHFVVRDNGIGMESQHLERIFDVFQRLHTADQYPGTGIGLALCRKVVQLHGGNIWASSESGRGSTFHFTLAAQVLCAAA